MLHHRVGDGERNKGKRERELKHRALSVHNRTCGDFISEKCTPSYCSSGVDAAR